VTTQRSAYRAVAPFVTKDGSVIRELMHPAVHGNVNQSFAEAIVPVGGATQLHRHHASEEIYHFVAGEGLMTLGARSFAVRAGDTICIPPGTPHRLRNTGGAELKLLCACAPAYSDDDTELLSG
jgi:mannose-6-phosphate isomerase-like protein (cupin superfamily)